VLQSLPPSEMKSLDGSTKRSPLQSGQTDFELDPSPMCRLAAPRRLGRFSGRRSCLRYSQLYWPRHKSFWLRIQCQNSISSGLAAGPQPQTCLGAIRPQRDQGSL